MDVTIHGAGLMGRALALCLHRHGHDPVLLDPDPSGASACAWTGAGMLAPASELDGGEPAVFEAGRDSMHAWPALLEGLEVPLDFPGTLVVAHGSDRPELARFQRRLAAGGAPVQALDRDRLRELEPGLDVPAALFIDTEGHLDNRAFIAETNRVLDIRPAPAGANGTGPHSGWTVDCRGLGARDRFPELRGVRGELLHLHAPEVTLHRPVRVLHPRYPLYIVPREDHRYVVGASQIESEDMGPMSVRTTLELLTAAYALHPGFAEARILDTSTHCRPAFPDNLPRIHHDPEARRLAVNGLFRHGFLLAPLLAHLALRLIESGSTPDAPDWIHPWPA